MRRIDCVLTPVLVLGLVGSVSSALAQDPRAPEAVGSIPGQTISAGESASVDLTAFFSDADGDALAYAATASDVAIAAVSVSGSVLTIAGVAPGTAVVTVFASDPGGLSATQRTQVTVAAPNRAPEPVGTIPRQTLAPGQWVSLSVSSYFRDPDGETLSFSAMTSDPGVAGVEVSGNIVTITQAGMGTAIVNAVARDPGGLSVQQSIIVAAVSGTVASAPAQPEAERLEPVEPERTRPGAPTVDEAGAGVQSAVEARQPDPFPPRLLTGFVESTGYTLAQGRGHLSAGYLGANPLAQATELGDFVPGAGQVSYGVTDELTLTAGSGFFYYNVGGGDSDLFPYFAPRFRAWHNDQLSVAVTGYLGLWLAEETVTYYGGSIAGSIAVNEAVNLHASGGMLGISATILGETLNEQIGVVAVGGDFHLTPELGLAGEFRRVGFEDGTNILTGGLRFLQALIAGEVGLAYYLEDEAELRPVASLAFRF
ncbi:MAG: hypothetical protein F4X15_16095 [Gemmatimonadetes bacterium]|nr:hypothetical protein [Gemmatimonadota bacterium]MYC92982.1 hypothetical protein [Gemmatimonadota bacterium]